MTLRELVSLVLDRPNQTTNSHARLIGYAVIFYFSSKNGLPINRVTKWRVLTELKELGIDISDMTLR